jgi:hypothetical protein
MQGKQDEVHFDDDERRRPTKPGQAGSDKGLRVPEEAARCEARSERANARSPSLKISAVDDCIVGSADSTVGSADPIAVSCAFGSQQYVACRRRIWW